MSERRTRSAFPKSLTACLEPLLKPVFKAQGWAGSRLLTQWESIVGRDLAAHSLPEKLSFPPGKKTGGTLTVSVENGFAPEFQHRQSSILERLATYFGYPAIARITISHSWPRPLVPAARAVSTPLPPACAELAAEVADGELKAALLSLAKTLSAPPT